MYERNSVVTQFCEQNSSYSDLRAFGLRSSLYAAQAEEVWERNQMKKHRK